MMGSGCAVMNSGGGAQKVTRELDLANWKSIPEETLLTVSESADILRMSESKVRLAIKNNMLKHYRPTTGTGSNGDIRVMMTDLLTYLEGSRGTRTSTERAKSSQATTGKPFRHVKPTWLDGTSSRKGRKRSSSGTTEDRSHDNLTSNEVRR